MKETSKKKVNLQDSNRLILLKQELLRWEGLNRINKSVDYQTYLKPILEQAINNKWPDPAQEDFDRKYIIDYSRAKAFQELYETLARAESAIKALSKQVKEPDKNYEI